MPFEILNQNEYILIKLKGECGNENINLQEEFQLKKAEWGLKFCIVNCTECSMMNSIFMRHLAQVYRDLKTLNGQIRLVGCNPKLQDAIKNSGLDRILMNKMSLRGALVDFGLVKQKEFDVNFINPFLNATQKVLKIQCFIEAKPLKPHLKKPTDPLLLGDVSGIISINSETFSGTLAISLPEKIFLTIVKNMLGEEMTAITDQNVDLVGEIANIILGQAKLELIGLGYSLQAALPSCVWGKDHKIKHFGTGVCVVIPFETPVGTFYSEIMTNNGLLAQVNTNKPKVA